MSNQGLFSASVEKRNVVLDVVALIYVQLNATSTLRSPLLTPGAKLCNSLSSSLKSRK